MCGELTSVAMHISLYSRAACTALSELSTDNTMRLPRTVFVMASQVVQLGLCSQARNKASHRKRAGEDI